MLSEFIKIIPSLLWFTLAVTIVALFYRQFREEFLPSLTSLKAAGVELCFVREAIKSAVQLAEKSPGWKVIVPETDKQNVLNRLQHELNILKDAAILWVDDHPENTRNERRMFHQLAVQVDTAKSTDEAMIMLGEQSYDLVFSDMARGQNLTAGLDLLAKLKSNNNKSVSLIFYVGYLEASKGTPPFSFGITNRPDELLHLTLDALGRRRY